MTWFGRDSSNVTQKRGTRTPVPAEHDDPSPPVRALPVMSPARAAAIAKLIESGRARSRAHAEFKAKAGVLELPD